MNISHLKTFVCVAEQKSFSRAAELLHITQPAISQQMKKMESELGCTLLVRDRHHVGLTAAGEAFEKRAREVIALYDCAVQACLQADAAHTQIAIQHVELPARSALPAAIRAFAQAYPDCAVTASRIHPRHAAASLMDDRVTFVIAPSECFKDCKGLTFLPLYEEVHYAVLSAGHPLAGRGALSAADFAGYSLLTSPMEFRPAHMINLVDMIHEACPDVQECSGYAVEQTIITLLSKHAIAPMPGYVCPTHPQLKAVPLSFGAPIPVVLAYHKKLNTIEKTFAAQLQKQYRHKAQIS